MFGVITQKDIIDVIKAHIDILENVIEIINDTSYLKNKKQYDDKTISKHIKFVYGDPNKPKESPGLINSLLNANESLLKIASSKVANSKNVKKKVSDIVESIDHIITISQEKLGKDRSKEVEQVTKNVINIKKLIDAIASISRNIFLIALLTPLLIIATTIAILGVTAIIGFIWVVSKLIHIISIIVTDEDVKKFDRVKKLFKNLLIICGELILMALITPAVIIASIVVIFAVAMLTLCTLVIVFFIKLMAKMVKKVYDDMFMIAIFYTLLTIIMIGLALGLLIVALITKVLINMIADIIIFLVMLIVITVILSVIGFIISAVKGVLFEAILGLLLVAVIMVIMVVIAAAMLIVAFIAQYVIPRTGDIIVFIGLVALTAVLLAALGLALLVSSTGLLMCMGGLAEVAIVLTELVIVATLLLIISLFDLDQNKITKNIDTICNSINLIAERLDPLVSLGMLIKFSIILANMVEITGVVGLMVSIGKKIEKIAKLELDQKVVTTKLNIVFGVIDALSSRFGDKKLNKKLKKAFKQAKRMLRQVKAMVGYLKNIGEYLAEIVKLELDGTKVRSSMDIIFEQVDYICEKYSNKKRNRKLKRALRQAKKMMKQVSAIVETLGDIAETLKSIQDIELKDRAIKKKVTFIWDVVDDVRAQINERFKTEKGGNFIKNWWNRRQEAKKQDAFLKELGKVGEIVKVLGTIAETLNSIQEIELKDREIKKKVTFIWDVVDDITAKIQKRFASEEKGGNFIKNAIKNWWNRRQEAKKQDAFLQEMGKVGEIIKVLGTITETLNSIQDIKINKNKIDKQLDFVWKVVEDIKAKIQARFASESENKGIIGAIKNWWNRRQEAKKQDAFLKELGKVGEVVKTLGTIAETLNSIQKIKLNKNKIDKQLDFVWKVVEDIKAKIQARFAPKPDEHGFWGAIKGWLRRRREQKQQTAFTEEMGKIAEIMGSLQIVVESLKSIQDIKVDLGPALTKVNEVFDVVDKIVEYIKKRHAAKLEEANKAKEAAYNNVLNNSDWYDLFRWNRARQAGNAAFTEVMEGDKRAADAFLSALGPVTEVLGSLGTVIESLKTITKYRIVKDSVISKINRAFDVVDSIIDLLNKRLEERAQKNREKYAHLTGWKKSVYTSKSYAQAEMSTEAEAASDVAISLVEPVMAVLETLSEFFEKLKNTTKQFNSKTFANVIKNISNVFNETEKLTNMFFDYSQKSLRNSGASRGLQFWLRNLNEYHKVFESLNSFNDVIKFNNIIKLRLLVGVLDKFAKVGRDGIGNFGAFANAIHRLFKATNSIRIRKLKKMMRFLSSESMGELFDVFSNTNSVLNFKLFAHSTRTLVGSINKIKQSQLKKFGKLIGISIPVALNQGFSDIKNIYNYSRFAQSTADLIDRLSNNNSIINFRRFSISTKLLLNGINKARLISLHKVERFLSKHLPRTINAFRRTKNVQNYSNFVDNSLKLLDKINEADLTKLNTTVQLFKEMAHFSESINGNFEQLAETLNEKIMPLLEEFKNNETTKHTEMSNPTGSQISQTGESLPLQNVGNGNNDDKTQLFNTVQTVSRKTSSICDKLDQLLNAFNNGRAKVTISRG